MLRQVFYGFQEVSLGNKLSFEKDFQPSQKILQFVDTRVFIDAGPREIFILTALVLPMVGIGLYPQFCLTMYSSTIDNIIYQISHGVI